MAPSRPARPGPAPQRPRTAVAPTRAGDKASHPRRWLLPVCAVAAIVLLGGLYLSFRSASQPVGATGTSTYQVGTPATGAAAPPFTLPSTTGQHISLSAYRGKSVLLYFHEGLGCQPCWDQIRDLQRDPTALRAAGVDQLLTITSGPQDLIAQKMNDDKLTALALADTDLAVSRTYNANNFGMMGNARDGHTFILVGADGSIQWRADYGGAPRYTMYVPVPKLIADLKAGRRPA